MADVARQLRDDDFFDAQHKAIWGAMLALHRKGAPIDCTLLVGEIEERGDYGHGNGAEIHAGDIGRLFDHRPYAWHWEWYAQRIMELGDRRRGAPHVTMAEHDAPPPADVAAILARRGGGR